MTKLDLHLHSCYSYDGDFSPAELVELCLQAGVTHAAITDHNAVRGVPEALAAASQSGVEMIPAIEIDTEFNGVILHLLGYGIDHTAPVFKTIEDDVHKQEQDSSGKLMQLVRQLGIDFEDDVVDSLAFDGVITGEMIAEAALVFDHENKNPLLDPYRGDGDRSDNAYVNFYWDYCSQGKPAYVPMSFISLSQAIAVIQQHHGVPILAHPGIQVKEDSAFLQKIIAEGIRGLEVYTSYHTQQQAAFYREAALSSGLIITCGSDFHGKTKKSIKLGGIDHHDDAHILDGLLTAMGK